MKRNLIYLMAAATAVALSLACSEMETSTTAPTASVESPTSIDATRADTDSVVSAAQGPRIPDVTAKVVSSNPWVIEVCSTSQAHFVAASYNDPDRDLSTQTLFWSKRSVFLGCRELSIATPACGQYQVDVFRRTAAPEPPVIDNTLIIGRIGTGTDCAPPPPPPPPPPGCRGEECNPPPRCELNFDQRKTRCENAGGLYVFDVEGCDDACIFPPRCNESGAGEDCPPPQFSCEEYEGYLCHATGTQHQSQLFFDGIPPGHCKHLDFYHSPGQGPTDTLGLCEPN